MKVLITGAMGQLGRDLYTELLRRDFEVIKSDIRNDGDPDCLCLDITDQDAVMQLFRRIRPDAVIHCAAWTAVDAAEEHADAAWQINACGTRYIAAACAQYNSKLIYVSTEYVFSGRGDTPWQPDDVLCEPLSVYGRSKRAGEEAVCALLDRYFIVRTSWVWGMHGSNFVHTMLRAGRTRDSVSVVMDQVGTPTYTVDLSRLLADMVTSGQYGIYHASNEGGYVSWYEFCCEIYRQAGIRTPIHPVTTAEYGLNRAERPLNSRLDKSKLRRNGFEPLPDWKDALIRFFAEYNQRNQ